LARADPGGVPGSAILAECGDLRRLAIATGLSLVATGCIPPGPPTAVAVQDGLPSLLVKFCDAERGLGTVVVSRVTRDEPESWPVVWRARLTPGATPLAQLPIDSQVTGYTIKAGDDWPLKSDVEYAVTDSRDDQGYSVGVILNFRISELSHSGRVVADEGDGETRATWLGAQGPACR
jgi:hypothetical protein